MSVFNIFQTVGYYGFNNWVPSLLVKQGITVSTSLGYTTVIALAAPIGPLLGFFLGDRFERKWIIVASAGAILVCGLIFGQALGSALIVTMGVGLTLAANIMSFSFHAYQQELFPTGIRARAAGFVYSWSRLSVIFSSVRHRLRARARGRHRRLCFHRRGDGRGDGDDRPFRAAHHQSGFGGNLAGARLNQAGGFSESVLSDFNGLEQDPANHFPFPWRRSTGLTSADGENPRFSLFLKRTHMS